ncbi:MAG: Cof-type HAD-IIB family hydrolase [Pararhizobium sp.]
MTDGRNIDLLLSDVDGTLVDPDKQLTPRALAAVHELREKGVRFAIASSRPPRGVASLIEQLALDTPIAGFNGGLYVDRDFNELASRTLPADVAGEAAELIRSHGLDVWVFRGQEWFVDDPDGAYVEHEMRTVQFRPTVVADVTARLDGIAKMVGVGADFARVEEAETAAQGAIGKAATVARSQSYYLDITALEANKGAVVDYLSRTLDIPRTRIATIGDHTNDVKMFERSGLSIAMGNASDAVKAKAMHQTASNREDGFALAVERFILGGRAS